MNPQELFDKAGFLQAKEGMKAGMDTGRRMGLDDQEVLAVMLGGCPAQLQPLYRLWWERWAAGGKA